MPMPKGFKHSEESKRKMSKKLKNKWDDPEYRKKQTLSHLGYKPTDEHRKNLSLALKGKPKPWQKGIPRTAHIKKLMSEKFKGENNPFFGKKHTAEIKRILSKKHTGLQHTTETKIKIGNSLRGKGKTFSVEHKKNLSKAHMGIQAGENNPRWNGGSATYYTLIAHGAWEDYWREIVPKGYVIHHIDEDRTNNHITNLLCLPAGEHSSLHAKRRREIRRRNDFTSEFQSQAF